ncbi:hypothetical protein SBA3_3610019 [Candidatus Sulfopaludibacter sp. SbA3]|nr:hypothetical protein SBA3_3610019 [Candidatus Sulfopaludibacter sp. SbA3]
MQRLGRLLLAGAALPGDQHVHLAVANAFDQTHDLLDLLAGADDAVRRIFIFDFAPQVHVLLHQFVLAAAQFADELRGFDGDGGMRSQRIQRFLVARSEDAADALIQYLEGSDDFAMLVAHRDCEHVSCVIAGLAIDGVVKARVAVGVFDIDRSASLGGGAGDAAVRLEAQNLFAAERHFAPQFVAVPVQQKDAGAVAIQEAGGFPRDQVEQRSQVMLGVHLLADTQNCREFLVQFGLGQGSHGLNSLTDLGASVYEVDTVPRLLTFCPSGVHATGITFTESKGDVGVRWFWHGGCYPKAVVGRSSLSEADRAVGRRTSALVGPRDSPLVRTPV